MQTPLSKILRRAVRLAGVLFAVGVVTLVDGRLLGVNSATAAFSYLLLVLALATRAGLEESIVASVSGLLCYNYFFLPPVGALTISDPENWVALGVFLITAITASHLSASAQRRAAEASARRQEMERVYEFSRALMIGDGNRRAASQIPQQVAEIFQVPTVAFYEQGTDTVYGAGLEGASGLESHLRGVARTAQSWQDANSRTLIVPVTLGGRLLGSLGVSGTVLSDVALPAIAQLAAIALERARAQEIANRSEAARQNEQLKSTLLDALAHEFKTPLTSIKAAISTVLTGRPHDAFEQDLLTVVDEEADRLTNLVTESIEVARLGAGQIHLRRQACSIAAIIGLALDQLRTLCDGRAVEVDAPAGLPEVDVDEALCGLVFRQLLGNALKYAPFRAAIRVATEQQGSFLAIHVANEGPGISAAEQDLIFEKFYRGREWRERIPGTGLGLTIAREIVHAHGGRMWIESGPGQGVRFSFTLPLARAVSNDAVQHHEQVSP